MLSCRWLFSRLCRCWMGIRFLVSTRRSNRRRRCC
ncbi:unnamed protein product [Linum tenue]|uniref:Uncharacterized protein n=1 Tax=Linum tenue TaxID=586396 RepID=A0AAV0P744_9ROSI|nr:unnamed protein product [Linum tenue]